MSGLLERIVRRARASASSQLGPGTRNGAATTNGRPYANGADPLVQPTEALEPVAPAPQPEPEPETALEITVGLRGRGRIRRRVRYLRRVRELQLRDLGGFMVELGRLGRERPELVQEKLEGALRTDTELRALERALGTEPAPSELREPGIGGACEHCGAIHGSTDRFCASCGAPLNR
jgi:hypothetical protein